MKINVSKKALMITLAVLGILTFSASFFIKKDQEIQGTILEMGNVSAERKGIQASLAVRPETLDLGTVKKTDGKREGSFILSNEGTDPLELRYAFASCGCLEVSLERQMLAPGGSIEMKFTYDPNYFAGESGKVQKQFTILSSDLKNPFKKVFLQAKLVP